MYNSEKVQAVIKKINDIANNVVINKKIVEDAFDAISCVATVAVKNMQGRIWTALCVWCSCAMHICNR